MPTVITHSIVSGLLGKTIKWEQSKRVTVCSVLCGSLPDLDVIGRHFGVAYLDHWGHRGLSHSVAAALVVGLILSHLCSERGAWRRTGWTLYFATLTSTHGLLDMLTNGGHGVAILGPWSHKRHFFPDLWRVIEVSPFSYRRFTWERLSPVFESELIWIISPTLTLFLIRAMIARVQRPEEQ